jgi:hypothetical protein
MAKGLLQPCHRAQEINLSDTVQAVHPKASTVDRQNNSSESQKPEDFSEVKNAQLGQESLVVTIVQCLCASGGDCFRVAHQRGESCDRQLRITKRNRHSVCKGCRSKRRTLKSSQVSEKVSSESDNASKESSTSPSKTPSKKPRSCAKLSKRKPDAEIRIEADNAANKLMRSDNVDPYSVIHNPPMGPLSICLQVPSYVGGELRLCSYTPGVYSEYQHTLINDSTSFKFPVPEFQWTPPTTTSRMANSATAAQNGSNLPVVREALTFRLPDFVCNG